MAESYAQGHSPETLPWVLWTVREGRRRSPQRAWGGILGPGRIISQVQGLVLSPVWPKKQLMRLQGQRSRVRIPGGLRFSSCIRAIRIGMGWVPQ